MSILITEARINSSTDECNLTSLCFSTKNRQKIKTFQTFSKISRKYHEIKNTFSTQENQENQDWWIPWNCFKHSGGIATKHWKILTPEK